MKKAVYVVLILCSLFVSACKNTANGIGQDMEKAGQDIQHEVH